MTTYRINVTTMIQYTFLLLIIPLVYATYPTRDPTTGCFPCEVSGEYFDGNTYFAHRNGCIEYECFCKCDGGWNCPGSGAVDLCRKNRTSECYYCEIDGYLYQGRSQFDLVRDCYKFPGCTCDCDGGWTCEHTTGESVCDHLGKERTECNTCTIDGKQYRGNSMFHLKRDCVQYTCTCDCDGRYYCPAADAMVTCWDRVIENIVSLSSGGNTRETKPVDVDTECGRCYVDATWYKGGSQFTREVGCNQFTCNCYCNGEISCPAKPVYICGDNSISGGGSGGPGLDATSGSRAYTVSGISRGSAVGGTGGSSVNVCSKCEYLGVVYEGNAPFMFEKGCWQYNCFCKCDGGFNCPSNSSKYICDGRKECVQCDLTDYDEGYKEPNTVFQIRRGCDLFEKCRCNCDGGWSCDDGVYACEIETGCMVDGRRFAGGKMFELTRGCDKYKDCVCNTGGDWSCIGQDVEDVCDRCRKCKIGDFYYDGDTQFSARVNCTLYKNCQCNCDGTYECRGGSYTCDGRSDQPPEGQCSNCLIDGKTYRNWQSFDYTTKCATYRGCQCRCGVTSCRRVTETCGDCRTCDVNGVEYSGGSVFALKQGCYEYKQCQCNCNGKWSCPGESAVDVCNKCRKCNVDGTLYEAYTKFNLDRKCWNYQCFCLCNGTTWCPSATVVNTCTQPDRCLRCEVNGRDIKGNTHFKYELNGMDMHCRCNCDGSYACIAEWLYINTDVSISGSGIGIGGSGCISCRMDGTTYRGDTKYRILRSGISLDCECNCDGSYVCYGEGDFAYQGCRGCSLYGRKYDGDFNFPLTYYGFKLSCRCSCDGSYVCLGSKQEIVVQCEGIDGAGCLPETCNQCIVDGVRFNGGDQFGTVYKGINLRCDCGCDGSYYCEGSNGLIISCVGGRCVELGCSSCDVYGTRIEGGSPFEAYYRGLKLSCQCECGGNYQCLGSSGEVVVECLEGVGCLQGQCRSCEVRGRNVAGRSTFRYDYNGIAMMCTCACDGSYYCEGVTELIEISCIGGTCTRLGCKSCSVFGQVYNGDSSFDIIFTGKKLNCNCACDSGYLCYASAYEPPVVTCVAGRGRGCLPSTCSACYVNGREFAGGSTFPSVYKGIDVRCTCGCDGSSFCSGVTTSIEVSCIGNVCKRIGCQECTIFGKEFIGGFEFDMIYDGERITCECDCDGGYICKSKTGVVIVTCVNGIGAGCLRQRCGQCVVDGQSINGMEKFMTIYQGINMDCTCSCDSSYYCVGVTELIEISCIGGTCTPVGCKTCRLFNKDYPGGASKFNLVYAGLLLNCQCLCDGSYVCKGESGTTVIQCRNGRGNCIDDRCRSCQMGDQTFAGGSEYRYNYEGVDVNCKCGCDGSVYCVGIKVQITVSCIGGKCSLVGCQNCQIYGREYYPLATFELIYSGYRLDCKCDCAGGYTCEGSTNLVCTEGDLRNCLPQTCGRCTLNGQTYDGNSVFKYNYKGIGMSCTCGCDSSIFCLGVTELIELRCVDGICSPQGCRTCDVFGERYSALSDFSVIYQGLKMDCKCACDSSFICTGSSGKTVYTCEDGQTCLKEPCRPCIVDGNRYTYLSQFAHKYKDIPMTCTCGCDGTSYCEGTEEVIFVSCIGETCSPINCDSCEIFGQQYQGDSNFELIYKGTQMDCACQCDTSYRCEGSTPGDIIDCPPGQSCVAEKCKKCRVNGKRYMGRSTFQYDYQGIPMNCVCGCDGSYYCQGVSVEIIISCQRRGGCRQIGGCRSCNIFGQSYPGDTTNQFVYRGYYMKCECKCDSSYRCLGTKNEVIIECSAGRDCLRDCNSCLVDGREYFGNTEFDYTYKGKNMRCACGCDGSYHCTCKDDGSEMSCNARGTCQWIGCNTCLSDGRQRQAYEEFEKYYDGIRMNCLCSCDGSYRCQGVDKRIVIICTGDSCSLQGCRSCIVNGREYPRNYEYEIATGSQRKRCVCKCDGTSECSVIELPTCTPCTIDKVTYKGHSRNRVYRGEDPFICDCYCNGTHKCYPEARPECRRCNIGGKSYKGDTNFEAVLEGTLMQCTCNCNGETVCRSDGRICNGDICSDDCRYCTIDRQRFEGKTSTVANVFGLQMQCQCNCDGSYSCTSDTKTCSSSGCVDNCRQCLIDGQGFDENQNFQADVYSNRMQCQCNCDGNYRCTSDTKICTSTGCVDNCRQCLIDGQGFDENQNFQADVYSNRMQCQCNCDGNYRCTSDTKICTSTGCVDNCRQCLIDGQRFDKKRNFQADVFGNRMKCRCECDGNYLCTSDSKTCTSTGCVDNCRQCLIDKQRFDENKNVQADVFGNRMQCSCECDGSYRCTSDTKTCTSSGCVDNCRQCLIDGQAFNKDRNFQADVFGYRMQCRCECDGSYRCTSDIRVCTSSGCVDKCRQCLIDKQRFDENKNVQADVFGNRMQCSCECDGSYRCTSDTKTCTSSGCVDNCRQCLIDGQTFNKNPNFQADVFGYRMQCRCECDGSYRCTSDIRLCTSSGCVDKCRQCLIDKQRFDENKNFQADVFGNRMQCSCECDGSYRCTSDTKTCTSSGCVDNCRQCLIDGQTFNKNPNFQADVFGYRMQCRCECDGSYRCTSDTRICTSSGCVDNCKQCLIDGRRYTRKSNFQADVYGYRMQCNCECDGSYRCESDTRICSSSRGCVNRCQSCVINGRNYDGNTNFNAILEGISMQCKCDCNGNYECVGGSYTCTPRGCVRTDSCGSCLIEGQTYEGNTRFEIFYNAYGIDMTCDCECSGSYTCKGTKEVTSCVGSGCTGTGCNNCVIDNVSYEGGTSFQAVIDGTLMDCVCSCNGGYRCTGTRTQSTCYGPGCRQKDDTCTDCVIRGVTYAGNSQFEIDGQSGVRMQCTCDCNGRYSCRGETREILCIGPGCDNTVSKCSNCLYDGAEYSGGSVFKTVKDGVNMDCTCSCNGEVRCEGTKVIECQGDHCGKGTLGCRRCVIDGRPYSGNTRFTFVKGNLDYNCVCFCDGSYNCKGSTGLESSCVGEDCAAEKCRNCELFDREYQLDARFRLHKNGLIMNCVCECDGAYRCFSISGTCVGDNCDVYGCKSCTAEGRTFPANSMFELSTGLTCSCECNGEYKCKAKSLQIECVGSDCGVGGCRRCIVDGDYYDGNTRFQIRKYGLLMQCACNCDSSYTCRGYQIISSGQSEVDTDCRQCVIDGRVYNGNRRFQTMIDGERKVCSCDCDGRHTCSDSDTVCRDCVIGNQRYGSNKDFQLYKDGRSVQCRCDCNGNFVCQGQGEPCRDGSCSQVCRECSILGSSYQGGQKFTTTANGVTLLCECFCSGEYECKGYRQITNVLLPSVEESVCDTCYVAGTKHPGNKRFKIQRGCFKIDCICGCDGTWQCPYQTPKYTCAVGSQGKEKTFYSLTGSVVYPGQIRPDVPHSRLIYTGEGTVFGSGNEGCRSCYINGVEYAGSAEFVLQDGCLRWTCGCDCSGALNCSAVTGSECDGPLSQFEPKSCLECEAGGNRYLPNKRFSMSDTCYLYSCMCNCDGSWECPKELTKKTCNDTSTIYDPERGTCRQCVIGSNKYNYGEIFELVDSCLKYRCTCNCDGSYHCPGSTSVRVCRSGSGAIGRPVSTGSNTVTETRRTVVAIRPSGYSSAGTYSASERNGDSFTSELYGGSSVSAGSRGPVVNGQGQGGSVYTSGTGQGGSGYISGTGQGGSGYSSGAGQGGSSYGSYSSVESHSKSRDQVDRASLFRDNGCTPCTVDGQSLRGGRDFTYKSGCIEHLCECFCNGTHFCDPEKEINFCEEDRLRHGGNQPKECVVGNRSYKTKLFSYEKDCKKFYCRCYNNGEHTCDPKKTRIVC